MKQSSEKPSPMDEMLAALPDMIKQALSHADESDSSDTSDSKSPEDPKVAEAAKQHVVVILMSPKQETQAPDEADNEDK